MPTYYTLRREPNSDRIIDGLQRLRDQLDGANGVPARTLEDTMLLATWNIREFDSDAYGERIPDAFYYIAEIVSRFDIVAIQEVDRNLKALRHLVKMLGWPWRFLVTDTTEGSPGNDERLAFVYDSRKVRFGGLAGELVLPAIEKKKDRKTVYEKVFQFARTPYTAGFSAAWTTFQLATVHIIYGDDRADLPARVKEIQDLAAFLAERAEEPERWSPNLVLLGDFNIYAKTDATMKALMDAGWEIPPPLQTIPGSNVPKDKFYDQIAVRPKPHWFEPTGRAGVFDFYESIFREEDQRLYERDMGPGYKKDSRGKTRDAASKKRYFKTYWRTFQMSDHLPMWLELRVNYSEEYLSGLRGEPTPPADPTP